MAQTGRNRSATQNRLLGIISTVMLLLSEACAPSTYQMQAFHLPAASHRMGGVIAVAQHDEILAFPEQDRKVLLASGLKPEEMPDGSLAARSCTAAAVPPRNPMRSFFTSHPPCISKWATS